MRRIYPNCTDIVLTLVCAALLFALGLVFIDYSLPMELATREHMTREAQSLYASIADGGRR